MEAKNSSTDEKFSPQEVWGEANSLIVAGSDTTSLVISAAFFYLTRNPEVLKNAKAEVRGIFKDTTIEDIRQGQKLGQCEYLRACLDETMRMTPPLPGILPRTVLSGGIEIDGFSVPAGTEVGVCTYALHHSELNFPGSFEFRPERFLSEEGNEMKAFAPFSIGPRNCIGKNMAYMEMIIAVARVLWGFEMEGVGELGAGKPEMGRGRDRTGEYQVKDYFICIKEGPMVGFKEVCLFGN
jgi:cytochrome P450